MRVGGVGDRRAPTPTSGSPSPSASAPSIGLVNGLLVNYVRIPSVVATLGMLGVVEGLAQMYTGGSSIFGDELDRLDFLARDELSASRSPC